MRIRAFFLPPPQQSQQVNKSTSQRVFEGLMRPKSLFGSDLGQKGPIEGPKHRFNPLKTQLTPIFNEYNHPTLSHRFFKKSSHRFNRFNKKALNGMLLAQWKSPMDILHCCRIVNGIKNKNMKNSLGATWNASHLAEGLCALRHWKRVSMPPTTQSLRHPLTRAIHIAPRIKTARRFTAKNP